MRGFAGGGIHVGLAPQAVGDRGEESRMSSFHVNPAVSRRGLVAGAAGLGVASVLAGCSNDEGGSSTGSGSSSASAFKIGAIGPLTGDNSSYGTSVVNGATLGARDFSDDTVTFEVQGEDDVADGETSVNAYNTLMDWGMQALVGPTTSGAAESVAAVADEDRTFMLSPSATSAGVTEGKTCVFRVCFTDPAQGTNAAIYISEHYPDEAVAVIYRNDDSYSQGIASAFLEQAEESGLNVVDTQTFTEDTQTDFRVQLTSVQEAGATFVFLPIYYTPASVMLTQANEMGYSATFFGVDGMDGILGVEGFDTSLAEGLMLMTPFAADDPNNADFVAAYEEEFGETPDQFAADAYDAVHAIHDAIVAGEIDVAGSAADICDALASAMCEIEVDGLTGTLSWTEDGEVSKDPLVYVIQDGVYVEA